MNPLKMGSFVSLPVALFVLVLGLIGTQAGVGAVVDGENYTTARENLTGTFGESKSEMYENASGHTETVMRSTTGHIFTIGNAIVGPSFDFGYRHPGVAWWYLKVAPVASLLGLGLYVIGSYRKAGENA